MRCTMPTSVTYTRSRDSLTIRMAIHPILPCGGDGAEPALGPGALAKESVVMLSPIMTCLDRSASDDKRC